MRCQRRRRQCAARSGRGEPGDRQVECGNGNNFGSCRKADVVGASGVTGRGGSRTRVCLACCLACTEIVRPKTPSPPHKPGLTPSRPGEDETGPQNTATPDPQYQAPPPPPPGAPCVINHAQLGLVVPLMTPDGAMVYHPAAAPLPASRFLQPLTVAATTASPPSAGPFPLPKKAVESPAAAVERPAAAETSPLALFKCKICGRSLTQRSSLSRHMQIHTEKRPHNCPHCGKCFTRRYNLKAHIITHCKGSRAGASEGSNGGSSDGD